MFATESTVLAGMRPRRFSRGMDVTERRAAQTAGRYES